MRQPRWRTLTSRVMGAMRNALINDFFGVDLGEVWVVIEGDLLESKKKLERLAGEAGEG
jgi:uncharacterized protein with HEPN domain